MLSGQGRTHAMQSRGYQGIGHWLSGPGAEGNRIATVWPRMCIFWTQYPQRQMARGFQGGGGAVTRTATARLQCCHEEMMAVGGNLMVVGGAGQPLLAKVGLLVMSNKIQRQSPSNRP